MSRTAPNLKLQKLAQRLADFDATSNGFSGTEMLAEFRVVEKLSRPLTTLAGASGVRSLLARSLSLAKGYDLRLSEVQVNAKGSLESVGGVSSGADVAVITELLGLLVAFIGESLTLSLVLEIWPGFPVADTEPLKKDQHDPAS
ncbi:MAG: hypothetical protein ABJF23_10825 [Bryobacteraceae bacterium]